jgi:hypothetical protein
VRRGRQVIQVINGTLGRLVWDWVVASGRLFRLRDVCLQRGFSLAERLCVIRNLPIVRRGG